jgi:choline dehydrogenase-like flavoprotein
MKAATVSGSGMELYAGACVGGSTVVNDALCWRPPPEVLERWQREHGLTGVDERALAPYVDRVWAELNATPTERLSRNHHKLELGARRLGWAAESVARNVRGCASLGLCNVGCPSGAKQSALLTWVPRAERAGARVRPRVRAERVVVEAGSVRAVEATRLAGDGAAAGALRIETPLVILAAGVLETPALLLRSGVESAGQGLQLHSSVYVTARFAEPVLGFYGPTMAYAVTEFSDVHGHRGPGFMLESVAVAPAITATSLPGFGAAHERAMDALPHLARAVVVLRDDARGRLTLDRRGAPRIAYQPAERDLARLGEAVRQLARLYLSIGAEEVWLPVEGAPPVRSEAELATVELERLAPRDFTLLYAVHLFGGAAMGGVRSRSVCDPAGRVWDVAGLHVADASALPGNTGANPQITVMANALRVAGAAAVARR